VRGRVASWSFSQCSKIFIQSRFRELIYQRGIPLTPNPSPALGRGEPLLAAVLYQASSRKCHYNLQSSILRVHDQSAAHAGGGRLSLTRLARIKLRGR